MDLGFGPDVNKLFKKARKAAREARERKYAEKERERQHEIGIETLRGDYAMRQQGLANTGALERAKTEGIIGLARQGLTNRGAMERLKFQERPGGIAERQVTLGEKEQERLRGQGETEKELGLLKLYQEGTIPKALTDELGNVVGYQEVGPSAGLTYGQYREAFEKSTPKKNALTPERKALLEMGGKFTDPNARAKSLQDFSDEELFSYLDELRPGQQQQQPVQKKKVKPQMTITSRPRDEE